MVINHLLTGMILQVVPQIGKYGENAKIDDHLSSWWLNQPI